MTQTANPLKQFFRQPALFLKLPGDGQFWANGSLELPPNKELAVLPMTAMDEITYRTPDALFNGSAVTSVIQSCVPGIKNAWKTPAVDLTAILIAIRIATYGSDMDVGSSCPSCKAEGDYTLDLHTLLAGIKNLDFSKAVKQGDLEIYFKSIDYQTQNNLNTRQFEQQRIIQSVQQSTESEEKKLEQINGALKEITKLTVITIVHSIAGIRTPNAFVSESEFIEDFLNNCDRKLFGVIRDHVIQMREDSNLPDMPVTCSECNHQYTQTVTLDSTSFFEAAS
jgi:hypothetical protein